MGRTNSRQIESTAWVSSGLRPHRRHAQNVRRKFPRTWAAKKSSGAPKYHRTRAAYSSKSPFKRNTCIQAPQAVRRDRFQTCIAFLANGDAGLVAGLRVSSYRRQFTHDPAIKQGETPAPGAHRHVRRRENVLDKEVSGKRRSC